MVPIRKTGLGRNAALLAGVCLILASAARSGAAADAAVANLAADSAFDEVAAYDADKPAKCLRTVEQIVGHAMPDATARRQVADRLVAMLGEGKLSLAARNFVCGQLAFVGDEKDVPVLAKMLAAAETTDMARRALTMIPGEASGKALRDAVGTLKGTALAGLVASLGERRDAAAVEGIAKCLEGPDEQVFVAAVVALGKIGTPAAAAALGAVLPTETRLLVLRDGQLRCAEQLAAAGNDAAAEAIYRKLFVAQGPARLRAAALTGLVLAGKDKALPEVLDTIGSDNAMLQATALRLARQLPGAKATAELAARLGKLPPPARAVLIDVLADRGDRTAAAAVAACMGDPDEGVRAAALAALGNLGDVACVADLLKAAAGDRGAAQRAARASLEKLAAQGVDAALLTATGTGDVPVRVEAITALANRRAEGAEAALTKLAGDKDEPIRAAALTGLANMGTQACYPKLVELVVTPPSPAAGAAAEAAALAVGARLEPAGRVEPLLAALAKAPVAAKPAVLRLIGGAGTAEALKAVKASLGDADAPVADAAARALADWPNESAADDLLAIAKDSPNPVHRTLALRGYLRMARTAKGAASERLKMIEKVRQIAATVEAKRLLLGALSDVADAGAMELALLFVDDSAVQAEAALATLKAGRALLAGDRKAIGPAMEKLMTKVTDAGLIEQAKALAAEALKPPKGAGGTSVGLEPDKKRSDDRKAELAKKAPEGFRLACYLDCGPDASDGAKDAPALKAMDGQAWSWDGAPAAGSVQAATIQYAADEVNFQATGLDPRKTYQVGLVWWDFDHDTRMESVWASGGRPMRTVKLLAATRLPSFQGGQKPPETRTLPIPRELTAAGSVRISFRNDATPNVVVCELWLWESQASSDPPPVAAAVAGAAIADGGAAGGAKTQAGGGAEGALDEPKPVQPGKKGQARVIVVTGIDYPGHLWRKTAPVLAAGLDKDPRLAVDVVDTPDFLRSPKLKDYDAIVLHFMNWEKPDPGPEARENLRKCVEAGKGLVLVHFACGAFQGWSEFAKLAGRAYDPKLRPHDPYGPFRVNIVDAEHPVTKGLKPFETPDELYTCLAGDAKIHVLATATSKVDKKDYPMAFVLNYGKGRVFHSPLGHDVKAFGPDVLELFRRGTAWAAGLDPALPAATPGTGAGGAK